MQFHTVFLRIRREAVNCETEGNLLVNALKAFRKETNKHFDLLSFGKL